MVTTIVPRKLKTPLEKKFTGKEPPRPVAQETADYLEFNAAVERNNAEAFSRELERGEAHGPKNGHAAAARRRKEVSQDGNLTERGAGAAAALNSSLPPGARPIFQDPIVRLPLALLERHPDNREPLAADIAERSASIKVHGILEPIIARILDIGRYQVLSGETRWRAVEQLDEAEIPARVIECDDARALELLAEFNAQRKDLDPIQKARLIERLCQAKDQGGAGLTREQAGRIYGLESGGAVSNLVGLLRLPAAWQKRVASGELPWTWARELVPYAAANAVFAKLDEDWKTREKGYSDTFVSRQCLLDALDSIVRYELRPLRNMELADLDLKDPAVRAEMAVLELPIREGGKSRLIEVATDAESADRLLEQSRGGKAKSAAAKAGSDEPPAKRELSPAEQQQKDQQRAKQLGQRIAAWRDKLLRRAAAGLLDSLVDDGMRLVLAYIPTAMCDLALPRLIEAARRTKRSYAGYRSHLWSAVANVTTTGDVDVLFRTMARQLLTTEPAAWDRPIMPHVLVERYAAAIGVDVAEFWRRLQIAGDAAHDLELLEEFLQLHRTDELKELAEELGVHVLPSLHTKTQIVKLLLGIPGGTRTLPLPKSIKPLAREGLRKAAKSAKAKR